MQFGLTVSVTHSGGSAGTGYGAGAGYGSDRGYGYNNSQGNSAKRVRENGV